MSGVVGWVDHQRDLSRQDVVVRAMAATMANRGPAGESVWTGRHAALGHRRLHADDTVQPVVVTNDGAPHLVVAYSGRIYNRDAVHTALLGLGHRLRTGDDAELIGRAYLAWGIGFAQRLDGMFAIAVHDERTGELVLARDRIGMRTLFYAQTPTGLVFGSERKAVLAHPQVRATVDATGLCELFSLAATPGEAVFHGMCQVPAGHVVHFGPDGVRRHRYWALEGREHNDDLDTTVATIRELLDESVGEHVRTNAPLGALLSGGLDSSTITTLAAKTLRERGADPLSVFTVSFARQDENFRADRTWGTRDDPFVADVAAHANLKLTTVTLDTADLMDPIARLATLTAKDLPSPLGNMNTSIYLLCQQVRETCGVALHGDPSDAIFGGFPWVFAPEIMAAKTLPWVARAHAAGGRVGFGADLLDPTLLKQLDLAAYCEDQYASAVAGVPFLAEETGLDRKMREVTYLHLTRWLEVLLGQSETMSAAVGLEVRWPYAAHQLVEYVFNVPWGMKDADERGKGLLRAAAADLLPQSVLNRHKSPFPVTQNPEYGTALCAELAALLADPNAPATPFVNVEAAKAMIADPSRLSGGSAAFAGRSNIEMLLQFNAWLDHYRISVQV